MESYAEQSGNFPNENNPLKLVVNLCSQLADKGFDFEISLKIKDSLQFALKSGKKASVQRAGGGRKRGASYRRRQLRRREAYLEKMRNNTPEKGGEGVLGLVQEESDQRDTGERNDASLDLDPTPWFWRRAPKGSVEEENESVDHITAENETTGMVVDLRSGGECREVNHEHTVPELHMVSDRGSNRFQAYDDLEAEYWREREKYLNDLEYDIDAFERYERDHDRRMSQLRSQLWPDV